MTGINRMGEKGAEPEQIEFAKLCLKASMESTAIDRIEQYRVGTAAAAACGTIEEYIVFHNIPATTTISCFKTRVQIVQTSEG